MRREPGFAASDVLLAVTTVSFDIAALELFLPLVTGGKVVIAESRHGGRSAAPGGADRAVAMHRRAGDADARGAR